MNEKMEILGGFNEKTKNLERAEQVLSNVFSKEELEKRLNAQEK